MKTEIDDISGDYQDWGLDDLLYRDGLLTLTLSTYPVREGDPTRYVVSFSDAVFFEVYDESDHVKDYHAFRDDGVIGVYESSLLLEYARKNTIVLQTRAMPLAHYSVMTTNEVVHVLTPKKPKVWKVTD